MASNVPSSQLEVMADEVVRCSGGSRGTIYAALRDAYEMGRLRISYSQLLVRQERERSSAPKADPDDIPF